MADWPVSETEVGLVPILLYRRELRDDDRRADTSFAAVLPRKTDSQPPRQDTCYCFTLQTKQLFAVQIALFYSVEDYA